MVTGHPQIIQLAEYETRDKNLNSREENHIIKEDDRRFSATTKKRYFWINGNRNQLKT